MLFDSLIIGLLVAKLRGGSFDALLRVKLTGFWLIVVSFAIQYGAIFFIPSALPVIIPTSYALLLLFGWLNRTQPGFGLVLFGIFMNLLVMVANRGRMPVDVEAARQMAPEDLPYLLSGTSGKHLAMSAQTHLNGLGDIFYLHAPYPHHTVISLGDLVFSIGVFLFLQMVMVKSEKQVAGGVVHG
ncbi:MAG: DUF5317 domain-containing protein [Tumebacillaceae bacterium]